MDYSTYPGVAGFQLLHLFYNRNNKSKIKWENICK
nr:MAG TPA_asm: hypothetical protein [Caudoviricetes sp.]DAN46606.1 MAG TPA: hypothetical protein [Caudoviricetes sp.]